jgi:hypothetical protein
MEPDRKRRREKNAETNGAMIEKTNLEPSLVNGNPKKTAVGVDFAEKKIQSPVSIRSKSLDRKLEIVLPTSRDAKPAIVRLAAEQAELPSLNPRKRLIAIDTIIEHVETEIRVADKTSPEASFITTTGCAAVVAAQPSLSTEISKKDLFMVEAINSLVSDELERREQKASDGVFGSTRNCRPESPNNSCEPKLPPSEQTTDKPRDDKTPIEKLENVALRDMLLKPYTYICGMYFAVFEPFGMMLTKRLLGALPEHFGAEYAFELETATKNFGVRMRSETMTGMQYKSFSFLPRNQRELMPKTRQMMMDSRPWVNERVVLWFPKKRQLFHYIDSPRYVVEGHFWLRAFYGAPVWTKDEVWKLAKAAKDAGMETVGCMSDTTLKNLVSVGWLGSDPMLFVDSGKLSPSNPCFADYIDRDVALVSQRIPYKLLACQKPTR